MNAVFFKAYGRDIYLWVLGISAPWNFQSRNSGSPVPGAGACSFQLVFTVTLLIVNLHEKATVLQGQDSNPSLILKPKAIPLCSKAGV